MRKLFCILLSLLLCFPLSLIVSAQGETSGGSASSGSMSSPFSLVETNSPAGAVGIAYNFSDNRTRYLSVFGDELTDYDQPLSTPGWFPQATSLNQDNAVSPDQIINGTSFTKVPDTTAMPYSAIMFGYVRCPSCDTSVKMPALTAFMISPNVAITAAHTVFHIHNNSRCWANELVVLAGLNGEGNAIKFGSAYEAVIPVQYYESRDENYDWALIRLSQNIGNTTGYFGYQYVPSATLEGITATLCGYPREDGYESLWYYQWQESGTLGCYGTSAADYNFVTRYKMDTLSGQSGSPIFRYHNGGWSAVAIHTTGVGAVCNQGVRITGQMFRFFLAYAPT